MDTTLPDLADDTSWLDSPEYDLPELPALSAEDEAMIEIVEEQVKVIMQVTAELEKERRAQRAAQRKKEDPALSPSEKISIRVPKHVMEKLRTEAKRAGIPYQTLINSILYDRMFMQGR